MKAFVQDSLYVPYAFVLSSSLSEYLKPPLWNWRYKYGCHPHSHPLLSLEGLFLYYIYRLTMNSTLLPRTNHPHAQAHAQYGPRELIPKELPIVKSACTTLLSFSLGLTAILISITLILILIRIYHARRR